MERKLAINGGEPSVALDQEEALHWPLIGKEEKERICELLDEGSGVAGEGWYTEAYRFEEEFGSYLGAKYALCHSNGTAAIHAALFAIGISPGDEVITPSYTYWASCMPILCWNAVPVFAEVDPKKIVVVQGVNPGKPAGALSVVSEGPSILFRKRRQDSSNGVRIEIPKGASTIAITKDEVLRVAEGRNMVIFYQGRKVGPKTIEAGNWMSFVPQTPGGAMDKE